jgi:tRNA modification GTPase
LLREGLNVVIAGKPNAGKSSLLNRLAGEEVAIVTDVPGTTRDVLRQQVHLDGLPLNLVDTAGLRPAADVVEAEGVRRARNEIARADHVLYLVDAGVPGNAQSERFEAEMESLPAGIPVTLILNKIDLADLPARLDEAGSPPRIYLSARTGQGLELLRAHLQARAGYARSDAGAFAARRRHLDALERARHHVQSAADTWESTRAFELFAEDLRLAQHALGEITGEFTSEDLLGEIFGSFCIGK